MTDLVFFYGTLMSGFKRPGRDRVDLHRLTDADAVLRELDTIEGFSAGESGDYLDHLRVK